MMTAPRYLSPIIPFTPVFKTEKGKKIIVLCVHLVYILKMNCEWDKNKARSNLKKHGVDFTDAVIALEDEYAITIDDPNPYEQRYLTIGMDAYGNILVVSFTWREETIRIISARKATKKERKQYGD